MKLSEERCSFPPHTWGVQLCLPLRACWSAVLCFTNALLMRSTSPSWTDRELRLLSLLSLAYLQEPNDNIAGGISCPEHIPHKHPVAGRTEVVTAGKSRGLWLWPVLWTLACWNQKGHREQHPVDSQFLVCSSECQFLEMLMGIARQEGVWGSEEFEKVGLDQIKQACFICVTVSAFILYCTFTLLSPRGTVWCGSGDSDVCLCVYIHVLWNISQIYFKVSF